MIAAVLLTLAAAEPATPRTEPPRLRCVKQVVTGSLARFKKICRTPDEWNRINDEARRDAEDMQRPGHANTSG